jgi:signal transduction histidine kinase
VAELLGTLAKALGEGETKRRYVTKQPGSDPARQELQKFVTYIQDELRSPLGSVMGLSQNIVEAETLEDAQAFARILLTEAQGVVEGLDAYLANVSSGSAERHNA